MLAKFENVMKSAKKKKKKKALNAAIPCNAVTACFQTDQLGSGAS